MSVLACVSKFVHAYINHKGIAGYTHTYYDNYLNVLQTVFESVMFVDRTHSSRMHLYKFVIARKCRLHFHDLSIIQLEG